MDQRFVLLGASQIIQFFNTVRLDRIEEPLQPALAFGFAPIPGGAAFAFATRF